MDVCKRVEPNLEQTQGADDHFNRCHLDQDVKDREAAKVLSGALAEAS
jgi:hypothetical protein